MTTEPNNQALINESQQRGKRLQRLRNLANLSHKDLCEESGININTYIGYEVGRYGGLTKNGSQKIINYLASKGVYSTFEWLMNGAGLSPRVETDLKQAIYEGNHVILNEKLYIAEEIALFKNHYANSWDHQIIDDGMLPIYQIGDHVAGVANSSINELIGSNCIVQLESGETLVRNLRKGKEINTYTLYCTNPETTLEQPIIYDSKLVFAAKIVWHRKLYFSKKE